MAAAWWSATLFWVSNHAAVKEEEEEDEKDEEEEEDEEGAYNGLGSMCEYEANGGGDQPSLPKLSWLFGTDMVPSFIALSKLVCCI